jgi:hypothetical protein
MELQEIVFAREKIVRNFLREERVTEHRKR